jgi:ribonuclease III
MSASVKPAPENLVALQSQLEARLAVSGLNSAFVLAALTHKSFCNEHREQSWKDNERLEFLGDAVVDLGVGQRLFERSPLAAEGELSKLRALLVNEEGLATIAKGLGLGELLILGKGEDLTQGRSKPSVLADALEAVIGAVYLSLGMPTTLQLVDRLFGEAIIQVFEGKANKDYKSLLQEDAQSRHKASPRYRVVSESGPDHEKVFEVEVSIGAVVYARSPGRSKKEAEQSAAKQALEALKDNG